MIVFNCTHPENGLTEDPLYYLHFEDFADITPDFYFFMSDAIDKILSGQYNDKKKVLLTLEEPNFCTSDSYHTFWHEHIDQILTICPYTTLCNPNRTFVFFPFSEKYTPDNFQKNIDVTYFGSFPHYVPWGMYIDELSKKYKVRWGNYNHGTDQKCSYVSKIHLYAQSKISIVHGLCNVSSESKNRYLNFPNSDQNKAFSHIHQLVLPQIKSRMFEAAFSKSLILCQKDYWNPIEYFFTPNQDFIYFENIQDLLKKTELILSNYEYYYNTIVESAYEKAISNYTVRHFVDKFLV